MRGPRRIPAKAPADFVKLFKRGVVFSVDGIGVYPPTAARKYWRVKCTIAGEQIARSGGITVETTYAAVLEVLNLKQSIQNGAAGVPENWDVRVDEAIRDYIERGGLHGTWKPATVKNRRSTFAPALKLMAQKGTTCRHLNASVLRTILDVSATSASVANTLLSALGTFMKWGVGRGYFTQEQAKHVQYLVWQPPKGYKPAPTRRQQSQMYSFVDDRIGGEVPTHQQVLEIAAQVQARYPHGQGLIHLAANTGMRANEIFALSASREHFQQGRVNYLDTASMDVHVAGQVGSNFSLKLAPTKNGLPRVVVLPSAEKIASGFDLRAWLAKRHAEALDEQARGQNPLALLFPNSRGGVLSDSNFRQRVMNPSLSSIGLQLPTYLMADGKSRRMYRFTLHSLRDRFAVTAKEEWGYSESQLLDQGSWADPATVQRFYLGTSDDTYAEVKKIHGRTAAAKDSSALNGG